MKNWTDFTKPVKNKLNEIQDNLYIKMSPSIWSSGSCTTHHL